MDIYMFVCHSELLVTLKWIEICLCLCLPAEEIVILLVLFLQSELAVGILICGFES